MGLSEFTTVLTHSFLTLNALSLSGSKSCPAGILSSSSLSSSSSSSLQTDSSLLPPSLSFVELYEQKMYSKKHNVQIKMYWLRDVFYYWQIWKKLWDLTCVGWQSKETCPNYHVIKETSCYLETVLPLGL